MQLVAALMRSMAPKCTAHGRILAEPNCCGDKPGSPR